MNPRLANMLLYILRIIVIVLSFLVLLFNAIALGLYESAGALGRTDFDFAGYHVMASARWVLLIISGFSLTVALCLLFGHTCGMSAVWEAAIGEIIGLIWVGFLTFMITTYNGFPRCDHSGVLVNVWNGCYLLDAALGLGIATMIGWVVSNIIAFGCRPRHIRNTTPENVVPMSQDSPHPTPHVV